MLIKSRFGRDNIIQFGIISQERKRRNGRKVNVNSEHDRRCGFFLLLEN